MCRAINFNSNFLAVCQLITNSASELRGDFRFKCPVISCVQGILILFCCFCVNLKLWTWLRILPYNSFFLLCFALQFFFHNVACAIFLCPFGALQFFFVYKFFHSPPPPNDINWSVHKKTKYYRITWEQPTCNFCSKFEGMKNQAVGKQENVLLFESPLTEMTGLTTFWSSTTVEL